MIIYFDIETLPINDPKLIADLAETIKPPATIKKPESINKWMTENKEQKLKKLVAETSLDGLYGQVACIAWAIDDGEIASSEWSLNEADAINEFYSAILDFNPNHTSFCGHDLHRFDLPFLKHRSIINRLQPPQVLINAMNAKAWDERILDTKLMWSPDRQIYVSMNTLCNALGIEGKGDFDGSMVAETWPVNPGKVIDYCRDDVARTREIYKRLTFQEQKAVNE